MENKDLQVILLEVGKEVLVDLLAEKVLVGNL